MTKGPFLDASDRPDYMPLACGNIVPGKISLSCEDSEEFSACLIPPVL